MIDLNELGDKLGQLTQAEGLGQLIGQNGPDPTQFQEMLGQVGIDPADLTDMAPDQVVAMLSEHGIDLTQFAETDLQGLIEQVSGQQLGDVANLAQNTASNGGVGELIENAFSRFLGK